MSFLMESREILDNFTKGKKSKFFRVFLREGKSNIYILYILRFSLSYGQGGK